MSSTCSSSLSSASETARTRSCMAAAGRPQADIVHAYESGTAKRRGHAHTFPWLVREQPSPPSARE